MRINGKPMLQISDVGMTFATKRGPFVALRDIALHAASVPAGQPLVASVRFEGAALPLTHYSIEVSMSGERVAAGRIATYLAG